MLLFNNQTNVGFQLMFGHSTSFLKDAFLRIFLKAGYAISHLLKHLKNLLKSEIPYVDILVDFREGQSFAL